jgi:hypothetical protein
MSEKEIAKIVERLHASPRGSLEERMANQNLYSALIKIAGGDEELVQAWVENLNKEEELRAEVDQVSREVNEILNRVRARNASTFEINKKDIAELALWTGINIGLCMISYKIFRS